MARKKPLAVLSVLYRLAVVVAVSLGSMSTSRADLVAHWPLDEGDGREFENAIDDQFDGYLMDDTVIVNWVPVEPNADGFGPQQDDAVEFTGTNSWIQTDFPGIGGNSPRTVTFWMKATARNSHMIGWGRVANGVKWHTRINTNAGNGVQGALRTEYQGGQNVASVLVDDGEWHHVAVLFEEGATNGHQIKHFVDGILDGVVTGGDRAINTDIAADNSWKVTIGATRQNDNNNRMMTGQLADVRIYDHGLTVDEIRDLAGLDPLVPCDTFSMTCEVDPLLNSLTATLTVEPEGCACNPVEFSVGDTVIQESRPDAEGKVVLRLDLLCRLIPGEAVTLTAKCKGTELSASCEIQCPERKGLVAHWPLDEGGGEEFEDIEGMFDGALVPLDPASIEWVDGPPGHDFAVQFSGASAIETPYPGIGGANPRTVTLWAKTTDLATHGLVGWGSSTLPGGGGKYHVRVNNNAGNGIVGAIRTEYENGQNIATTPIDDDQWHHFASVLPDGVTTGSGILHYVDGFLDPRSGGGDRELRTVLGGIGHPVSIGKRVQGAANSQHFTGAIADVRIYDIALNEDEVLEVATGGRCLVRRKIDVSRFVPGDEIVVNLRAVNITGATTLTETFPSGLTVSDAGGGTVEGNEIEFTVDADGEVSYTLSTTGFCETIDIIGSHSDGAECEGAVRTAGPAPTCAIGCSELMANGAPPQFLILGPIDLGFTTNADDPNCDDVGKLGLTDYLIGADGAHSEEDIEVILGDEIKPDFGGLAGGVGVDAAPNEAINPKRDEGILTTWITDTLGGGNVNFNQPQNLGDPLNYYIIFALVYLENTTDDPLDVTLHVGSDDAVKVLLNGEQIHLNPVCRGLPNNNNSDRVPATLTPGINTVLVAIVERAGGTGMRLHVYDVDDLAPLVDGSVVPCLSSGAPPPPPGGFRRGDTDASGVVDISDPIFNLTFQFVGGIDALPCEDAADVDDSGVVDISDPIYNLTFQFVGGIAPPPAPGPTVCGSDPSGDQLGCEAYPDAKCDA